ncbi:MAG: 50S ribosomal protein L33 [Patescibacteria group bacterium]
MSQDRILKMKCAVCKNGNYITSKNKKLVPKKLDLNKFCKTCRKNTKHKEAKITG